MSGGATDRYHRRGATELHEDRADHQGAGGTAARTAASWAIGWSTPASTTMRGCPATSSISSAFPQPDVNLEVGSGHAGRADRRDHGALRDVCCWTRAADAASSSATSPRRWPAPSPRRSCMFPSPMWKAASAPATGGCRKRSTEWRPTPSPTGSSRPARRPTPICARMGVGDERIFFVGNTMIDTLLANMERLRPPAVLGRTRSGARRIFRRDVAPPVQCRRGRHFARLLATIAEGARGRPVVFPVHPRSRKTLSDIVGPSAAIRFVDPQPYLEFNYLVRNANGGHHRFRRHDRGNDGDGRAVHDACATRRNGPRP